MNGLQATFTDTDIDNVLNNFQEVTFKKVIETLSYVGEKFVNRARQTQTYQDQTGNLRSSIGYAIVVGGLVKSINIKGSSEGVSRAREITQEVASNSANGVVLIGFAGMQYAAAVESKGYDVITNSSKQAESLMQELVKELIR